MKKEILLLVTILLISALLLEAINLSVFAKHKYRKRKHMGLVYKDVKQLHDLTQVITNSVALVDDAPAQLNFTLAAPRVALIIYAPCGYITSPNNPQGTKYGLNVDGADVGRTEQSNDRASGAGGTSNGAVFFWMANLAVGPHTIKGRFGSCTGNVVRIDERRLTVLLFEGTAADWSFVSSNVAVNTALGVLQDDGQALINLNLATPQKALILYSACNYRGDVEDDYGKKIAIRVDAADSLALGNCAGTNNDPDHSFIAKLVTLAAGAHTLKGRYCYADTLAGGTVTISERQFGVLLLDMDLETDYIESTNEVTVIGSTFQDDTEAQIVRNIAASRYLFTLYSVGKRHYVDIYHEKEINYGLKAAINVDGADYAQNNKGHFLPHTAISTGYQGAILMMPTGTHTVKGRIATLATGVEGDRCWVPERTFCCLWFPISETPPPPPPEAFEKKEKKQETNHGDPPVGFTRLRVLHRVTRIVPWVV